MSGKGQALTDLARAELAPALEHLRKGHYVPPFMAVMIPANEAEFVSMPEPMVDIIAGNGDFVVPQRGSQPVWPEMVDKGGRTLRLIVAHPDADEELRVLAREG